MSEWKPVVGGRAMLGDDAVTVLYRSPLGDRTWVAPHTWDGSIVSCDATDLTEHPDDARHRRLLDAAREAGKTWAAMRGAKAPKLQALVKMEHAAAIKALRAIVAELDQAEADHA